MAIKLGGKEISFFASSGALGFCGNGWLWERLLPKKYFDPSLFCAVLKTVTIYECRGNGFFPWLKIRPIFMKRQLVGFVNAMGLPGPPFGDFAECYLSDLNFEKRNIVVSIAGSDEELCYMALNLDRFDIHAIEINTSCPNVGGDLKENAKEIIKTCRKVTQNTRHDLILKISYAQDFVHLAREAEGVVRAVSFNSVPWRIVFPGKKSPFARYGGGGVSGKIVRWFYEDMATKIVRFTDMPVIMPVWDYEDIKINEEMGALAHSFGSVFIASPWWPTRAIKKYLSEK